MVIESKESSLANLIPWQKGQSGNPGGRPKDPVTQLIREKLRSPSVRGGDGTVADDVVLELLNIAFTALPAEKMRAIEYMLNRAEGSPRQSIELGTADNDPRTHALAALAAALRESTAAQQPSTAALAPIAPALPATPATPAPPRKRAKP